MGAVGGGAGTIKVCWFKKTMFWDIRGKKKNERPRNTNNAIYNRKEMQVKKIPAESICL